MRIDPFKMYIRIGVIEKEITSARKEKRSITYTITPPHGMPYLINYVFPPGKCHAIRNHCKSNRNSSWESVSYLFFLSMDTCRDADPPALIENVFYEVIKLKFTIHHLAPPHHRCVLLWYK